MQLGSRFFLLALAAMSMLPSSASAFTFAEGYSSTESGAPALLYYRAFTLSEGRENCETGARATSLRIRLPSTTLKVGDRIHRMNANMATRMDLIIEARDYNGALVPGLPIIVDVVAQDADGKDLEPVMVRSDLDYMEMTAPGAFTIHAQIYCDYGPVRTQLPLTIEE